jgi:hypothetical protein
MTVRAKFWTKTITHHHTQDSKAVCAEVTLSAVYGEENKHWSKATPQAEIKMLITNPDAIAVFELGRPYYVDFTPA